MANPYEKYAEKTKENPYAKYGPKENTTREALAENPVVRGFGNIPIGAMQLPGLPVEAGVMLGNLAKSAIGEKTVPLEASPHLKDWGAQGWRKFFEGKVGKADIPAPASEADRIADKFGQFVGGGLPFGPAGLAPSLTAAAGSEVGRATDQAGVTGGYGEPVGGIVGAIGPGLVRGQTTSGVRSAPSIAALRAAKNKAYAASEAEGAIFTPQAMQRLYSDAAGKAANYGHASANEPGIAAALKELEALQSGNVTLKGVDTVRKQIGNAGKNYQNQSQVQLAKILKDAIDDFTDPANIKAGDVLTGDLPRATELLTKARSLNQRYRLGQTIEEAEYQAKNQAASSGVGGNVDNAMRQKIKAILNNPKRRASFNKSEVGLMERIVQGSKSQNALRAIGGFSPAKGFLPAALLGHLGFSVAGAGLPTLPMLALAGTYAGVTHGSKRLAESITKRNFDRLSSAVRNERNSGPATARQRANDVLLELRRRAKLARQSVVPTLPGTVYAESP